jgi:hypothetical protein
MERIRTERVAKRSFPNSINNSSKKSESVDNAKNSGGNLEKIKSKDEQDIDSVTEDVNDVDKLLIQLKKNEPTSDNEFFRLAIIAYEMGDLNRSIVYAERFRNDEKARIAHLANGKLAMADVLAQLYLLCISLGWNFYDIRRLGVEHLKERQEDFKRQGWRDVWSDLK